MRIGDFDFVARYFPGFVLDCRQFPDLCRVTIYLCLCHGICDLVAALIYIKVFPCVACASVLCHIDGLRICVRCFSARFSCQRVRQRFRSYTVLVASIFPYLVYCDAGRFRCVLVGEFSLIVLQFAGFI